MKRYENYKTVAVMNDTHERLRAVKTHMMSIDRRVSNYDAVISELISVYEHASSMNKKKDLEESEYEPY